MSEIVLRSVSMFRRGAQLIRHAPGLRSCDWLWAAIRSPYLKLLRTATQRGGIAVQIAGQSLRLDSQFAALGWEQFEVKTYRAFVAAATKAEVVYDIGAHIGTYSILALKAGPGVRKVVAYEPHDATRALLTRHLEWNRCSDRAIVRGACCGARAEQVAFYGDPTNTEGTNGLIPIEGAPYKTINLVTVDQEVTASGLVPSLMKIDVEGAEFDVLQGAETTLRLHGPVLFLSIHEEPLAKLGITPQTIFQWLTERGYRSEIIEQDYEIHVVSRRDGIRG